MDKHLFGINEHYKFTLVSRILECAVDCGHSHFHVAKLIMLSTAFESIEFFVCSLSLCPFPAIDGHSSHNSVVLFHI